MSESPSASGNSKSDADLLDEYLLDAEVQGLTEKTQVTYRSDLKYFIEWLDGDLLDVDRHDLKAFLAHLKNERTARDGSTGLAPSTRNTYFSALNSCFKYLEWEGYIEENPVPAFRDRYMDNRRPSANSKRQLISIGEMSSLVHSILDPRDRALVLTLAKTGIRRGELVTIDVDDIDWDEQSFRRAAATRTPHYRTEGGEFVPVESDGHEDFELELPDDIDRVCGLRLPLGDHGVLGIDSGGTAFDPFTIELAHVLASNVEAALDRAEQERRLTAQSERLEDFAALSSHELRNRLQIALGTAERARAEDNLDAIDDVIETLSRMDRLITQLLTLARTGSVSGATESVALSGIAETAWDIAGVPEMHLVVEDDAVVTADRDALLEVFEMLFRTVVGVPTSECVYVGTLPDGFFLEDDDSAVEPVDLFEPTHSDGEAAGDSIYLVSAIADAHGWDIDVDPSDAGGTRFAFHGVDIAHVQ